MWIRLLEMTGSKVSSEDGSTSVGGDVNAPVVNVNTGADALVNVVVEQAVKSPIYNRLLLSWIPKFIERRKSDNEKSLTADYSVVLMTVEELVATGAMEFAVDLALGDVENLKLHAPRALSNRIVPTLSDGIGSVVGSILRPVFQEFGIKNTGISAFVFHGAPPEIGEAVAHLAGDLYRFLVAMRNRLQLDIDLASFIRCAGLIRQASTDPEGRGNMAAIEGILSCYENRDVNSINLQPVASERAIELFAEFVSDHSYQHLSEEAGKFGYPDKLVASEHEFSLTAEDFAQRPGYISEITLSKLSFSAAKRLPNQNSELAAQICESGYLPPVVSFAAARQRAVQNYATLKPKPIFPKGFEDD
jgi:hypothetical protein